MREGADFADMIVDAFDVTYCTPNAKSARW
jgi:hypothetical protein